VIVGHDEHAVADPRTSCGGREILLARQRVAPLPFDREGRELDAEKRRAWNMRLEVELAPGLPAVELVGAVDEAVLDQ
jgi:hypothetical protein